MPLSCLKAQELIYSFSMNDEEWMALKNNYRDMALTMPCCSSSVVPKENKHGTRFFAHKPEAGKESLCLNQESAEHLLAKYIIAKAAHEAGWKVATEVAGKTPAEEEWRADVLCEKDSKKVVFEVQLSPQEQGEFIRRQQQYSASGVSCFWLKKKKQKSEDWLKDRKELPIFQIDITDTSVLMVDLSYYSEKTIGLSEFIKGVFSQALMWRKELPYQDVSVKRTPRIELIKYNCWRCQQFIEIVSGYLGYYPGQEYEGNSFDEEGFVPLSKTHDRQGMTQAVNLLRQKNRAITPVGMRYSKTVKNEYFAASCPHCKALQGDFFVTHEIRFMERISSSSTYSATCQESPIPIRVQERIGYPGHWIWQGKSYLGGK